MSDHISGRWVEEHFPAEKDSVKEVLILAYEAGFDAGVERATRIFARESQNQIVSNFQNKAGEWWIKWWPMGREKSEFTIS